MVGSVSLLEEEFIIDYEDLSSKKSVELTSQFCKAVSKKEI